MQHVKISVVICAHNPRRDSLCRTLDGLKTQSLPHEEWEFLLIDNASEIPLASFTDLSWHPNARIIPEPTLGLTAARARGIVDSLGGVICFVDDDNILDHNYLQNSLGIAKRFPFLGCWGGEIEGEFEIPPPDWFVQWQSILAVRPLARDRWGNAYSFEDHLPCGAGMCVLRQVAQEYLRQCENSPIRRALGRRGASTASNEDVDLAYTAIDMGLGTGRFKGMRLLHLIPKERLELAYLVRLAEGMAESSIYLNSCREATRPGPYARKGFYESLATWLKWVRYPRWKRELLSASRRGTERAMRLLEGNRP